MNVHRPLLNNVDRERPRVRIVLCSLFIFNYLDNDAILDVGLDTHGYTLYPDTHTDIGRPSASFESSADPYRLDAMAAKRRCSNDYENEEQDQTTWISDELYNGELATTPSRVALLHSTQM